MVIKKKREHNVGRQQEEPGVVTGLWSALVCVQVSRLIRIGGGPFFLRFFLFFFFFSSFAFFFLLDGHIHRGIVLN